MWSSRAARGAASKWSLACLRKPTTCRIRVPTFSQKVSSGLRKKWSGAQDNDAVAVVVPALQALPLMESVWLGSNTMANLSAALLKVAYSLDMLRLAWPLQGNFASSHSDINCVSSPISSLASWKHPYHECPASLGPWQKGMGSGAMTSWPKSGRNPTSMVKLMAMKCGLKGTSRSVEQVTRVESTREDRAKSSTLPPASVVERQVIGTSGAMTTPCRYLANRELATSTGSRFQSATIIHSKSISLTKVAMAVLLLWLGPWSRPTPGRK